ncbi:sn-glycerol-3-phosphate ABC transporter ATP-binding protein UgpC [Oleispirillum naphthae]|uniref:sn-glycerol-3-phosphate ABC transporter ATP-binding protein UgpC n=1 Tax=Oleispirillum naphthae TaxID=2838853 RepID=UPI0030824C97
MATLSLQALTKRYDNGVPAVNAVSLDAADGEFIVIVGPSGCGKSTLLRLVAGLETVSGGRVVIDGAVVNDREPGNRDIAMVFQNYALYPHMTVAGNMAYGLRNRRVPKPEIAAKVRRAAEILELTELLERRPAQLSGGQRQRVAMGRAIVREPKVFLFDEPLSNLDAKLRVSMRVEIKRLQRRLRTTAVYVTHDQVEAMTLADRLVVMNRGVAEQIGPPLALYERPATVFVAGFIGSPAMNLLPAEWDGRFARVSPHLALALPGLGAPPGPLTLGIRPEHLGLEGGAAAAVELVEPLGADTLVHVRLADGPLLVARAAAAPAPDAPLALEMPLARLHLFDAAGNRIPWEAPSAALEARPCRPVA